MRLDTAAIRRGCPDCEIKSFRHLCGTELDHFRNAAKADGPLTVACTQQAAQFTNEIADVSSAKQRRAIKRKEKRLAKKAAFKNKEAKPI